MGVGFELRNTFYRIFGIFFLKIKVNPEKLVELFGMMWNTLRGLFGPKRVLVLGFLFFWKIKENPNEIGRTFRNDAKLFKCSLYGRERVLV